MNCLACGLDNPATVQFCKKCGAKMDLTADEIQAALVEKEKFNKKKQTEYWIHNSLILAIALFLLAMTLYVFTGGAPEKIYSVPSAAYGSSYTDVQSGLDPTARVESLLFPLPPN